MHIQTAESPEERTLPRTIADYTKALEFEPTHHATNYHRALAYASTKQYDLALADRSKVIEMHSAHANDRA